jgi:hypothetical protein
MIERISVQVSVQREDSRNPIHSAPFRKIKFLWASYIVGQKF